MSNSFFRSYTPKAGLFFVFAAYLLTLCPTVYLGDSGELTAAAFSLGIPHNSGYPLYGLIGKLFCLIPLGNVGFRMNLMSATFATLTVWMVFGTIMRMTSSLIASLVPALVLAFTPLLWSQTVSAEVYTLHTFMISLLIRLLWLWDEKRDFLLLVLLTFVTGISFCNHLQTLMLVPGFLFLILSGERGALFKPKPLAILAVIFLVALSLYLYLPIRTTAGAAIHWGDPDNWERFLEHISGKAHREAYSLNLTLSAYFMRTIEAVRQLCSQFGVLLIFSLWGWYKLSSMRWKLFSLFIIFFDMVYTVVLNTISLKYTAFTLPSAIVLTLLMGLGMGRFLLSIERSPSVSRGVLKSCHVLLCIFPLMALLFHYGLSDQSENYAAYEHATNMMRSLDRGNILILEGDNNLFPVVYGRIVEGMGRDAFIYDRHNILFKMPYLGEPREYFYGNWHSFRDLLEKNMIQSKLSQGIFYGLFDPNSLTLPASYVHKPWGILYQVLSMDAMGNTAQKLPGDQTIWKYYIDESFSPLEGRDFSHRQLSGHFFFSRGRHLLSMGSREPARHYFKKASEMGYDDSGFLNRLAIFLAQNSFFKEARGALEKAMDHSDDTSAVENAWGIYHYKQGENEKAIKSFKKAIEIKPGEHLYHNNLGLVLLGVGRREEAARAFQKSLSIRDGQPEIKKLITEEDLTIKKNYQPQTHAD